MLIIRAPSMNESDQHNGISSKAWEWLGPESRNDREREMIKRLEVEVKKRKNDQGVRVHHT